MRPMIPFEVAVGLWCFADKSPNLKELPFDAIVIFSTDQITLSPAGEFGLVPPVNNPRTGEAQLPT